ncbi:MAG: nuclear transport factor 2 family protein [Streptosporangiaceae bacterium]
MTAADMAAADMAAALDEVQAKLAGAHLVAEYFHGIDSGDLDRAMATWHPQGLSLTPGRVLEGSRAIRASLEKMRAAYSDVYHWVTNLSLTMPGDSTMHGECRIAALCVLRSGATIREVGTIVLDYTRTEGTWLISREAVTIQRRDPAA